jgi:Ca-activated chloride channel homolog
MHFLNPSAFYLAAFIPIVGLLHFLKLRRQTHVVSSVMLWLEAIEDMKANVPFQRLRNSLPLILQLLFLSILIVSIARPALRRPGMLRGQLVLIIDNSASMQATESGKTRLNAAKVEALTLIERLDASGQMMIVDLSRPPRHIRQAFTADREKLRRAVESIPVYHLSPDFSSIFDSVGIYADTPNTQIFFISDSFENLPTSASRIHKIGVGQRADNIGIVQFSVTRDLAEYQVLVGVQNFTDVEQKVPVWLEIEGSLFDDETLVIVPGRVESVVFTVDDTGFDGQVIQARLDLTDDLEADNVAAAILHPPPIWRVLLVSDRRQPLLTHILRTNPHVDLLQIPPHEYLGTADRDIVIFDRFVPETLPDGNAIFFNPVNGLPFMSVQKNPQPVRVIDQVTNHPVMHNVSLIDLQVKASLIGELPGGIPLVETTGAPLIWLREADERKTIIFAFDPFDLAISDFALTVPAAPILMSQCLEWLGAATARIQPDVVKTGEAVTIRLDHPAEIAEIAVRLPDGSLVELPERSARIPFIETNRVGVYTVSVDGRTFGRFAVNLLNPGESNLAPPESGTDSEGIEVDKAPETEAEVNREVWSYAAFVALLMLVAEWWVYHRRVI